MIKHGQYPNRANGVRLQRPSRTAAARPKAAHSAAAPGPVGGVRDNTDRRRGAAKGAPAAGNPKEGDT